MRIRTHRPSLVLSAFATVVVLAAAAVLASAPAHAESFAASASSAGSVSSRQLSDSIGQSSDSSSRDRKVAEGEYRVVTAEAAPGRAGTTRLQLEPVRAEGGQPFVLYVPDAAVATKPLQAGDHVLARQRAYGFEFARAENQQAFLLALRDDWHRELDSHPVTL